MTVTDPRAFVGAEPYYARYRPWYPAGLYTELTDRFGLNGTQRALDLGCGPGTVALPLAPLVAEVIAVDPAPGMLEQGRLLAAERGVHNVRWQYGDSTTLLGMDLPPLDLCVMAKAFHWMDRDQVLSDLAKLTTPQSGVVIVSAGPPGTTPLPAWAPVVAEVRAAYLGTARRAGRGFYPEPQEQFRDTLARSAFSEVTLASWDHRVVRSVDELVGLQFSNSYSTPVQLGRRRSAFERDLRQALLDHDRSGRYEETIRTDALIATRP
ncbi:class I SAM-dependent methyltransferase [Streptomyces sp. AC1-42T]|uniref:class I SAM-dependent methyltransferase n=1 Tax=Streptomyces sp. AC1-42T TaxID=2218665 RepID=UPI000DAE3174|nr:class I SAM-dependent methyltransferase [Streptomyces sp. AC1-42T]PZT71489.1 class I SAM-dependent methyltransferase [Streptomyces sp. AC1-42T]